MLSLRVKIKQFLYLLVGTYIALICAQSPLRANCAHFSIRAELPPIENGEFHLMQLNELVEPDTDIEDEDFLVMLELEALLDAYENGVTEGEDNDEIVDMEIDDEDVQIPTIIITTAYYIPRNGSTS